MKTIVIIRCIILKCFFMLAGMTFWISAQSQTVPQMVFVNPVLTSGTFGEDSSIYLFSNVVTGYDATIQITGRSSASVVLSSIDTSGPGLGYTKAFQPVLGIPGNAPANTSWSMNFKLTFYKAGTSNVTTISEFTATGLDIDGDGGSLSEWAIMEKVSRLDTAIVNSLTFTKLVSSEFGDDYKVEGVTANAPGIDTTATSVMAAYKYTNKSEINFTIGAKTNGSSTSAGMRLNSIWFREFFNPALPVKLMSFTAILNNSITELKWVTATEIKTSHFVIEKSKDGHNYREAGIVFAVGNSVDQVKYAFTDRNIDENLNVVYYRLRIVDIDGKSEYSDVRVIRINKVTESNISILTYPNPFSSELRITIPANWQNKQVAYELFNANGQSSRRSIAANASQTETLNVSTLAPGFYIMRVTCEGISAQQKIVKH